MLAVVVWKWGTSFGPHYVNRLRAMVARHLQVPHTFWCITDDYKGVDRRVRCVPIPDPLLPNVSPAIFRQAGLLRARRVQLLNPEWAETFGPRLLQIDLDTVITGDITSLIESKPEPICVLGASNQRHDPKFGPGNPSLLMFDNDAFAELWQLYGSNPTSTFMKARESGRRYADGAVVGWYLNIVRREPWSWWSLREHGIYNWRVDLAGIKKLPADARLVMFMNARASMEQSPPAWLAEHWNEN